MPRESAKTLRSRWTAELTGQVNHAISKRKELPSPFAETINGYLDYRGLAIEETIASTDLNRIDFSFATTRFGGMFNLTKATDCLFCRVHFASNIGNQFEDCDFSGAKMTGERFRGKYVRCIFQAANLTSAQGVEVRFQECDFSGANFRGSQFLRCRFDNCQWKDVKFGCGSIARATFLETWPDEAAFGNHIVNKVTRLANDG